jgi:hypothetical protein
MTPDIKRHAPSRRIPSQAITGLRRLGVPASMLYRPLRASSRSRYWSRAEQGFWMRDLDYLAILERARTLWRAKLKSVHPDRPGGCSKRTRDLNALWGRVRKAFAAHGFTLP